VQSKKNVRGSPVFGGGNGLLVSPFVSLREGSRKKRQKSYCSEESRKFLVKNVGNKLKGIMQSFLELVCCPYTHTHM